MTNGYDLSRRQTLGGLATIGVAGAGAGLGTSALFSDSEDLGGNLVASGELDMRVAAYVRDQNGPLPAVEIDSETDAPNTADGDAVTITAGDLTPGDWFLIQWDVAVCSNPAYVQVTSPAEAYENDEGDNPEPETDTEPPGDLGGALLSTIWHTHEDPEDGDPRWALGDLVSTTDRSDAGLEGYEQPDGNGVTSSGAQYTTMDEVHETYKTGVTLRNPETDEPLAVGCEADAVTYYQLFELPAAVGNEVQGDTLSFTLRFDAEQARNNADPFGDD